MKIAHTRAMLSAALDGRLDNVVFAPDPNFGLMIPQTCPDVPETVLNPKNTWSDKAAYDATAHEVARMFEENFKEFESQVNENIMKAGIHVAA